MFICKFLILHGDLAAEGQKVEEKVVDLWADICPWLLDHGIKVVIIGALAYLLDKLLIKFVRKLVKVAVKPEENAVRGEEEKREDTIIRVFTWVINIVVYLIAALMIVQEFGVPIGPLLTGAGIVGVAVGFGAQYLVKDIITGLFLIIENHYRIGDEVDLGGKRGVVEDITLRVTKLRDINGTVHSIPHGEITTVSNFSKSFAKINLDIGISYSADIDKAKEVVNKIGEDLAKDAEWGGQILKAPYFLRVNDLGDSSVVIKVVGETMPNCQYGVTGELRKRIKTAFDKEGIDIPFPQLVVHNS